MRLPLLSGWRLVCDALGQAREESAPARFSLPGADELAEFADLIGDGDGAMEQPAPEEDAPRGVPFALPGALPPQAEGPAEIFREIDFGSLTGERATLRLDLIAGKGEALLGGERLAAFEDGPLEIDVTDALRRARRRTLTLRFDGARPAGVFGAAMLRVSRFARMEKLAVLPDAAAGTMTVRASVLAEREGEYALRATFCTRTEAAPAREVRAAIAAGQTRELALTMDAPCGRFVPGEPYDAPALRVRLVRCKSGAPETPCDEDTLLCGFSGDAPRFWLALTREECAREPEALARRLCETGVVCVRAPSAPAALLTALTRAGVAVRLRDDEEAREQLSRFPCAVFAPEDEEEEDDPALAAWRLCGMTAFARAADPALPSRELLREAAGREIDPDAPGAKEVLAWLRAVAIRLRAEALRQGARIGALCRAGEWEQEDAADALRTALLPLHLSALPLYGAWWTTSRFSASLQAFIPQGEGALRAVASLEDEAGNALAEAAFSCPPGGGKLGLIEAALPDQPCVLTLHTRLLRGEEIAEESAIPVYVGERGPLEAAFDGAAR